MLTRNLIKDIHSLELKKNRDSSGLFLAEGPKMIEELSATLSARLIVATEHYLSGHPQLRAERVEVATPGQLRSASLLRTPQDVLGVFAKPEMPVPEDALSSDGALVIALDGVQDPGNLGTIVRLANWFGVSQVWLSADCADAFSPKAVQASMGALARVGIVRTGQLGELLKRSVRICPVMGTFMDGENLYGCNLSAGGVIVMGSEGRGISPGVAQAVTLRIGIPPFAANDTVVESLNVGIATAVVCSEVRRQQRSV